MTISDKWNVPKMPLLLLHTTTCWLPWVHLLDLKKKSLNYDQLSHIFYNLIFLWLIVCSYSNPLIVLITSTMSWINYSRDILSWCRYMELVLASNSRSLQCLLPNLKLKQLTFIQNLNKPLKPVQSHKALSCSNTSWWLVPCWIVNSKTLLHFKAFSNHFFSFIFQLVHFKSF